MTSFASIFIAQSRNKSQNVTAFDFLKPYVKIRHRKLYAPFGMMTSMLVLTACGGSASDSGNGDGDVSSGSDDFTDTPATASTIAVDSATTTGGEIEAASDQDWHKIVINESGEYLFLVNARSPTINTEILGIYDENGNLVNGDIINANNYNNDTEVGIYTLDAGAYYFAVGSANDTTGDYRIIPYAVREAYISSVAASSALSPDTSTSSTSPDTYDVTSTQYTDLTVDVADVTSTEYPDATSPEYPDLTIGSDVTIAEYPDATSPEYTDLTIGSDVTIAEYPDATSPEYTDLTGDVLDLTGDVADLTIGEDIVSINIFNTLSFDEAHLYRLFLTANKMYSFETVNEKSFFSPAYYIFDATATNFDSLDGDFTYTPSESGDYYFVIYNGQHSLLGSDYTLHVFEDDLSADSATEASLTLNRGNSDISGIIDFSSDEDWHQVTITEDDDYAFLTYSESESSSLDIRINGLYDINGTVISSTNTNINGAGGTELGTHTLTAGTYYLSVTGADSTTGGYYTQAHIILDALQTSTSVTDTIESGNDIDFYALSVTQDTQYTITVTQDAGFDGNFFVLDETATTILGATNNAGTNIDRLTFTADATETYYIYLYSSDDSSGDYQLDIA